MLAPLPPHGGGGQKNRPRSHPGLVCVHYLAPPKPIAPSDEVVAVGVSSASSARNPCRPVSCLHAGLQSTYPRTAVHLRLQLHQPRFIKERALITLISHCSCQSSLWRLIGVKCFWLPLKHSLPPGKMPPPTRRTTAAATAEKRTAETADAAAEAAAAKRARTPAAAADEQTAGRRPNRRMI